MGTALLNVIDGPGSAADLIVTGAVHLDGRFDLQHTQIDRIAALNIGAGDTLQTQDLYGDRNSRMVVNAGSVLVDGTLISRGGIAVAQRGGRPCRQFGRRRR
ncbi:MAG: hypothetical protein WDN25_18570 [Acetobacteraceae bacterium]